MALCRGDVFCGRDVEGVLYLIYHVTVVILPSLGGFLLIHALK